MYKKLLFYYHGKDITSLKSMLKKFNIEFIKTGKTYTEAIFRENNQKTADELQRMFMSEDMHVDIISYDTIYEAIDIEQYEYFYCSGQVLPNTTIKIIPENDFLHNDSFDCSDFCENCMLGMVQTASLKIKGVNKMELQKKKLLTPFWEIWIVSEALKKSILEAKLSGVKVLEIYNSRGEIIDNIAQIKPTKVYSGVLSHDCVKPRIKYNACTCGKNTFIFKNNDSIILRKEVKKFFGDFNELAERKERLRGIYILHKKFISLLFKNGITPGKDIYIYPCRFI